MKRQYALQEEGFLNQQLVVSESNLPETIEMTVVASDGWSQTIFISQTDWFELCNLTGKYSSTFRWAYKDEDPPTK